MARLPRIGVISPPATASGSADKTRIGGLERGLRELGYVEGEQVLETVDVLLARDDPGLDPD